MTEIGGTVESGFEGVREAFERNFAEHGEVGAAVSAYKDGHKVVDLWGGVKEKGGTEPYGEDTLQLVFSTTKGATAACANLLGQRGELDLDAPVAQYWPEFAAEGKGEIPVRWLLCHKAGLPYVDHPLSLREVLAWDPVVDALAHQAPVWEPGSAHGYHAVTYGWLVGEVVRRVTGKSLGTYFAEEIAGPLGLEFWVGLPDEQQDRVAPLVTWSVPKDPDMAALMAQFMGPDTMLGKALGGAADRQLAIRPARGVVDGQRDLRMSTDRLDLRRIDRVGHDDGFAVPVEPDRHDTRCAVVPDVGEPGRVARLEELLGNRVVEEGEVALPGGGGHGLPLIRSMLVRGSRQDGVPRREPVPPLTRFSRRWCLCRQNTPAANRTEVAQRLRPVA